MLFHLLTFNIKDPGAPAGFYELMPFFILIDTNRTLTGMLTAKFGSVNVL